MSTSTSTDLRAIGSSENGSAPSQKFVNLSVSCYGIKKRCRRINEEDFNMGELPAECFNLKLAKLKAIETVRQVMRSIHPESKIILKLLLVTIKNDHGMVIRSCTNIDITKQYKSAV